MVVPKDLRRIVAKWDETGCFCIKTLSIFCDWMMLRVAKPSASRRGYQRVSVLCDFIFLWWLEGNDVTAKAGFCFFSGYIGGKTFLPKILLYPDVWQQMPSVKIFLSHHGFLGEKIRGGPFTVSWPGPLFANLTCFLVGDPLLAGTRRQSAGLPAFLVVGCNGWMSHSHESGRSSSCWGWRWGPVHQWHLRVGG